MVFVSQLIVDARSPLHFILTLRTDGQTALGDLLAGLRLGVDLLQWMYLMKIFCNVDCWLMLYLLLCGGNAYWITNFSLRIIIIPISGSKNKLYEQDCFPSNILQLFKFLFLCNLRWKCNLLKKHDNTVEIWWAWDNNCTVIINIRAALLM